MLTFSRLGAPESEPGRLIQARVDSTGRAVDVRVLSSSAADIGWRVRAEIAAGRAQSIRSQHVAQVLGLGTLDGMPALAFEPVAGPTLADMAGSRGVFQWFEVREFIAQIATGLVSIHQAGLLHGNLSTGTIRVPVGGLLKLTDIGFDSSIAPAQAVDPRTRAPEGLLDARSDLYSLGIVALDLLLGPARPGTTVEQRLAALPVDAQGRIRSLLAASPDNRPASAQAVVASLRQPAATSPLSLTANDETGWGLPRPSTRPTRAGSGGLIAGAVFMVAVIAVGFLSSLPPSTSSYPIYVEPTWEEAWPTDKQPIELPSIPGIEQLVVAQLHDLRGFSGPVTGEILSADGTTESFAGSMTMSLRDSEIVLGPDKPYDGVMPRYVDVTLSGNYAYFLDRSSGSWIRKPRSPTDATLTEALKSVGEVADRGDSMVGDTPVHELVGTARGSYAGLFGFGDGDVTGPTDLSVTVWANADGALIGMQLQFTYMDAVGVYANAKRRISVSVVFGTLSSDPIAPPQGPFGSPAAPSGPSPTAVLPAGSASSSPASPALRAQVLAAIQAGDFQFAAGFNGAINSENFSRFFSGSMLAHGEDTDVSFVDGGPGDTYLNPRYDRLVRVGTSAYRLLHGTADWVTVGRAAGATDSFGAAFRSIRALSDGGTMTVAGKTVHRLVADSVSRDFANVFGVDPGFESSVRVRLEVWARDGGALVGLETVIEWTRPPVNGQTHYSMAIDAVFDRLSDVSISVPV